MDTEEARYPGASAEAIRAHYDVGNDFYRLWLDETMTYSAAMWRDERDTSSLADVQRRKNAWHLHHSEANRMDSLLDIGCGWGGQRLERQSVVGRLLPEVAAPQRSDRSAKPISMFRCWDAQRTISPCPLSLAFSELKPRYRDGPIAIGRQAAHALLHQRRHASRKQKQ